MYQYPVYEPFGLVVKFGMYQIKKFILFEYMWFSGVYEDLVQTRFGFVSGDTDNPDTDLEDADSDDDDTQVKSFPASNEDTDQPECPICLEKIGIGRATLNCKHTFCMDCISKSLTRTNTSCPLCREQICIPYSSPDVLHQAAVHADEVHQAYIEGKNDGYEDGHDDGYKDGHDDCVEALARTSIPAGSTDLG